MVRDLMYRNNVLYVSIGDMLNKQFIRTKIDHACPALLRVPPGTLVEGGFTRVWLFCFLPTTLEPTASLDSKLAEVVNRLVRQIGRYLR
jgi:hypothetical protein